MRRFGVLVICLAAVAATLLGQEQSAPHASKEAAIQLLRREGILHGKTRVDSANWAGDFWIISLRHPDGKITNWTVNARATDYSYVCQH